NEDSIYARIDGGVDVSPWTDASHTASFRAASYGVLTEGVTWSGTVTIRGDLVLADTVTLVISKGTIVRFQAGYAVWDTLGNQTGLTPGRCDLIVEAGGQLLVNGAPPDSVRLTSSASSPLPGDWGTIYFDMGATGSVTGAIVEDGTDGIVCRGTPS